MNLTAAIALLCASGVSGFATMPSTQQSSATSLRMGAQEDGMKKAAASFAFAAFLMSSAVMVPDALAVDGVDFGSSQVIAGRSGGRAGGRSSARPSSMSRSAPSRSTNTRVIERTTVIQPSPMYSSPSVIMAPPMYNPMGGLGLGLGLNAMGQIGNDMRDYRQESEIQQTKSALQDSRSREAQMEARLRQLETQGQVNQMSQQQMSQQQMLQQAK